MPVASLVRRARRACRLPLAALAFGAALGCTGARVTAQTPAAPTTPAAPAAPMPGVTAVRSGGVARPVGPRRAPPPACCALLERALLRELNRARTNPNGYALVVQATVPDYQGALLRRTSDSAWVRTKEGAAAAREAVRALRAARPMASLHYSVGMSLGAADHVRDQGRRGGLAHRGSDGSMAPDRANRYGQWYGRISENMSFGPMTARDVVVALLVDDGIPDRGHRRNVLDPGVRIAGVSCGAHKTYRLMCDIVHAAAYTERRLTASRD